MIETGRQWFGKVFMQSHGMTLQSPCSGKGNAVPLLLARAPGPTGAAHAGLQHSPVPSSRMELHEDVQKQLSLQSIKKSEGVF